MRSYLTLLGLLAACVSSATMAEEQAGTEPRSIPLTRPVMKQYLEDMKSRTPRIPLPEQTPEELEKALTPPDESPASN